MSTVIKAAPRTSVSPASPFNFDDLSQQASRYVDKVQAQAAQIIVQAEHQAVDIRTAAHEAGLEAARKAAEQSLDQKLGAQLESLLPALREAIAGIQRAKHDFLRQWERQSIHLAAAMARRIIRRELSQDPQITLQLVREALELATGSTQIRVLLNPADFEALQGQVQRLAAEISGLAPAELLADPAIQAGGCRVETRHGAIDQQIESQLARIEEELADG